MDWDEGDAAGSDVAILGVPFDMGSSNTAGQRAAPRALRTDKKTFGAQWQRRIKRFAHSVLDCVDTGDIEFDGVDGLAHVKSIRDRAMHMFDSTGLPIFFGGDHTVTSPIVKGMFDSYGEPPTVLVLDAHPDFWAHTDELIHSTWIRDLVDDGWVGPVRVFGVRGWPLAPRDWQWAAKHDVKAYGSKDVLTALAAELDTVTTPLYVSVDIDVVDPAFAPGVAYREPAGITSREFIDICQLLGRSGKVNGIDFVEYIPDRDYGELTQLLLIHGIAEFVGGVAEHRYITTQKGKRSGR
jgi:agmatinase